MSFWDTFQIDGTGPKYLALCEALAHAIETGRLGPGRRLPYPPHGKKPTGAALFAALGQCDNHDEVRSVRAGVEIERVSTAGRTISLCILA